MGSGEGLLEACAATALDLIARFRPAGERVAAPPSFLSAAACAAVAYRYQTPVLLLDMEPCGRGGVLPSGLTELAPALSALCRSEHAGGGLRLLPNAELDLGAVMPHPVSLLAFAAQAAREGRLIAPPCEPFAEAKRFLGPAWGPPSLEEGLLVGGTCGLDSADPLFTIAALLLATGCLGSTRVINASTAPEVTALADLLVDCGCRLHGAGTPRITLSPPLPGPLRAEVKRARLAPDRPSVNLLLALVAAAGGSIEIVGVRRAALGIGPWKLMEQGMSIAEVEEGIRAWGEARFARFPVATSPFPGADRMELSPLLRVGGNVEAPAADAGWEEPDWSWERVRLVRPGLYRLLERLAPETPARFETRYA